MAKTKTIQTKSTTKFIEDCINIHGDKYDYSLVEYTHSKQKVKIICSEHGVFEQTPNSHLRGARCIKCYQENMPQNIKRRLSLYEFVSKSNKVHNNMFDYSKVKYTNCDTKVEIICPKHGSFWQTPYHHINRKISCPTCNSSKGELAVRSYLISENVKFKEQMIFSECKNPKTNKYLKFDFYLPDYNICIEFDGKQHFVPHCFGSDKTKCNENFENVKERDAIKNEYCKLNNIQLIRIPYTMINNIKTLVLFQNTKDQSRTLMPFVK